MQLQDTYSIPISAARPHVVITTRGSNIWLACGATTNICEIYEKSEENVGLEFTSLKYVKLRTEDIGNRLVLYTWSCTYNGAIWNVVSSSGANFTEEAIDDKLYSGEHVFLPIYS